MKRSTLIDIKSNFFTKVAILCLLAIHLVYEKIIQLQMSEQKLMVTIR